MRIVRAFFTIVFIAYSSPFALSDAYSDLANALNAHQPVINLPETPVNWGTTLNLTYDVVFNNTVSGGGPVTFNGGEDGSNLFLINDPISTIWNGDYIFENTLAVSGAFTQTNQANSIFNGNVTFQNNAPTFNYGGSIINLFSLLTFNQNLTVQNNAISYANGNLTGVAIAYHSPAGLPGSSGITFNGSTSFLNNSATLGNGYVVGAAIGIADQTVNFNAPVIFSNNQAITNSPTSGGLSSNAYGGAIGSLYAGIINLTNPQFINNQAIASNAIAYGGAIFTVNAQVTINATNPASPVIFQGNKAIDSNGTRLEGIYLSGMNFVALEGDPRAVGPSTLILNTDVGTVIDIQDAIASDGSGNTITKQGPGILQISGDSSRYLDTTTIVGGGLQIQPGAVFGSMSSGTVTIGPGGTLIYSVAPGVFPLLQGATINLDGSVTVIGSPGGNTQGAVARSGTPILVNGSPATTGSVLKTGNLNYYNWQLVFLSPTELDLVFGPYDPPPPSPEPPAPPAPPEPPAPPSIADMLRMAGANQNDINVAQALDAFDVAANPGELADYIIAIEDANTPQEALHLVDALQGEVLTGSFDLLQTQLANFNIQIDERLNSSMRPSMNTAFKTQGRILLASADKQLPLSPWSPAPWVGWGQILGGLGRQNVSDGSNAYDSALGGLTAGFDRALDRNWRLGGAVSLQRGLLDWDEYSAQTRANTLVGSLYGSYDHTSWFVRSQLGGGGAWVKNQRDIPLTVLGQSIVTASSDATLPFFDGVISTGYHFYYKDVRITPSGGLFYLHMDNDPFSETGAGQFNLYANRSNQDNLEAQGNLEVAYIAKINERPVTLRVSYGLAFEALDKQNTITTGFLSFPNLMTFNASSVSPGRWTQIAEVGMNVEVAKNVRLRFDYLGLFARHQYTNIGAVGVKVAF